MGEIRGFCKTCTFQDREMVHIEDEDGQLVGVEDTICGIFDVFVSDKDFCSFWETKE